MSKKLLPFDVLLVAGIDTIGLARFPRLLNEADCRVTLLSPPGFAVNRSRFVARHIATSRKLEDSILHLKEVLSMQNPPFAHVIIGDEPTLVELAKHQGEDWLDGWFPVDHRSNALETILSKHAFYHEMEGAGVYMPYSKLCQGWTEVQEAVKQAGYPIILKAQQGCSGSAVHKVHDSSELEPCYNDLVTTDEPLLVQHFCLGVLGATDVLYDQGVPVCWQSFYKHECWPTPLSASSSRVNTQHPEIESVISEVGRITGFHGFSAVDWIHETSTDRICLLELNPRPIPSYHLDRYAGVSFSRSLNQLLSGQRIITPPKPVYHSSSLLRMFPQNLYWAMDNRSLRAFILCWSDAPCNDPMLIAAYLRRVATHYMPKHWKETLKRCGQRLRKVFVR